MEDFQQKALDKRKLKNTTTDWAKKCMLYNIGDSWDQQFLVKSEIRVETVLLF